MSIVLFSAYRSFPRSIKGLGYWSAGSFVMLLAAIPTSLRGRIPDWLSFIPGNTIMILAIGLWVLGTQSFYGRKPTPRLVLGAVVAGAALSAVFLLLYPSYAVRLAIVAAILAALYCLQVSAILREGEKHFATWFLASVMTVQTLVLMIRCVSCFFPALVNPDFYSEDLIQGMYLLAYAVMSLLIVVGFMMVSTQRLRIELEHLSNHDPLTKVMNRRAFAEAYAGEQRRNIRFGRTMSLLLLDIDYFKKINDQYGHAIGDKVLTKFCADIGRLVRSSDYLARVGGEEFALLLPETPMHAALVLAERIRHSLEHATAGDLPGFTTSIGIAEVTYPQEPLESVTHRADRALYLAKNEGRNCSRLAESLSEMIAA